MQLVKADYHFLFDAVSESKTKKDINAKWDSFTLAINSMCSGKQTLTTDQVVKKWTDLKSSAKLSVMKYRKAQWKTGGGQNKAKEPTEQQWLINSIIGEQATQGIPGAETCDSSMTTESRLALVTSSSSSASSIPASPQLATILSSSSTSSTTSVLPSGSGAPGTELPSSSQNTPNAFLHKRRKTPRQVQLDQNEKLLKTESEVMDAVAGIRDELQQTNSILAGILFEMKRSNDLKEAHVQHDQVVNLNNVNPLTPLMYNS